MLNKARFLCDVIVKYNLFFSDKAIDRGDMMEHAFDRQTDRQTDRQG